MIQREQVQHHRARPTTDQRLVRRQLCRATLGVGCDAERRLKRQMKRGGARGLAEISAGDGIGCGGAGEQRAARMVAQHDAVGCRGTPPFLHGPFGHKLTERLNGIASDVDPMNEFVSIRGRASARSACAHCVRAEQQHSSGNSIRPVRCGQEMDKQVPK